MEKETPGRNKSYAKRTTIVLDDEEREFIDKLIREGKESGIKPLISKMLDIYRSMMVYDWRFPGEYYCGISRIAFMNLELANILVQNVPKEKWREVGRKMGEAAKVSMETTLGIQIKSRNEWSEVLKRLRVQGFGDFYIKDKFILIKAPFISESEIWAGFLEGLLDVQLDIKTQVPPFVFEIKTV
ncbi:hypothetical protein H5T51_09130 [Candidatus Bathyarchaeota archaeon]|nr:hypothetical protein [Candidatus Bathyarchaeota archaeon]